MRQIAPDATRTGGCTGAGSVVGSFHRQVVVVRPGSLSREPRKPNRRFIMISSRARFGLLTFLFVLVSAAFGQTFRGGIAGSVADASAAAIPDASVKIEHTGTGLTREVATSTNGDFNFPDLPAGRYTAAGSR